MSKAFIELRSKQRKYKLNANDISKLYKIVKRKTPSIPGFDAKTVVFMETDDDCSAPTQTNLWGVLYYTDFNIFHHFHSFISLNFFESMMLNNS